jgi:hypothetical protein
MIPQNPEAPIPLAPKVDASYKRLKDGKLFRILEIDPLDESVWVCRCMCQTTRIKRLPLAEFKASWESGRLLPVIIIEDPAPLDEFRSPAQQAAFEKLRPGLQEIMLIGYRKLAEKSPWPLIVEKANAAGVKPASFDVAFSKVLMSGGRIDAALPRWDKSGRWTSSGSGDLRPTNQPGSYPLAVVDLQTIADGVREFMRDEASWGVAHDKFIKKYYLSHEKRMAGEVIPVAKPPGKRPSVDQFRYHGLRLVPYEERMRLLWGDRHVDMNMRGCPVGQSVTAIYPGFVWEIDWTWSDNVAVAKGSRLAIGRLTVYGIADPFDGYIYGVYACLGNASVEEAGQAISQATQDKVALCAGYGLEIDPSMWRGGVLPARLRFDQGELDSYKSSGLATSLGIQMEACPTGRGDLKGTIESIFRQVADMLQKMDGGTSGHRERLKEHPHLTAIFDLDQLQKLLFLAVIKFNHRIRERQAMTTGMVADKIQPVPAQIQEWAIARGLYRDADPMRVRLGTLPSKRATVTKQGIKIEGLNYKVPTYSPASTNGIDQNDWLMRARAQSWEVEIAQIPSTVDYILLRYRPPGEPLVELKCELADEHEGFLGLTWGMYRAHKEESTAAVKEYQEGAKRDVVAFVDASVERLVDAACAATKFAREGLSKKEQIDGTDERRADEKGAISPAGGRKPPQPDTRDDDLSPNRAVWDQANNHKTA